MRFSAFFSSKIFFCSEFSSFEGFNLGFLKNFVKKNDNFVRPNKTQ